MYKKIFFGMISIITALLLLCSCSNVNVKTDNKTDDSQYVKAVWLTYYELSSFIKDKNESEFKKTISKTFKELKSNGFNRITVQVRPYADAFYKSEYFPTSAYCSGVQGKDIEYDPLFVMTDCAHKYDLYIEAWINPYRVSTSNSFDKLSQNNIALKWKDTDNLIICDSGIYFNPASQEVNELIVNGVKEIVTNYQVDGICFDDYFYPTTEKDIDKNSYDLYKEKGGNLSLEDFRRNNVNELIKSVYSTVKSINENVTFGISPASNVENNYNSLYADVELWATQEGYVDYLCPQIYFGFLNENQPFMKTVKNWISFAKCDLYVALPLYKTGQEDEFAGAGGIKEFVNNNNIIARQVTYLSKLDEIKGYYIFSYSFLKDNDECKNLYSAMQNSSQ